MLRFYNYLFFKVEKKDWIYSKELSFRHATKTSNNFIPNAQFLRRWGRRELNWPGVVKVLVWGEPLGCGAQYKGGNRNFKKYIHIAIFRSFFNLGCWNFACNHQFWLSSRKFCHFLNCRKFFLVYLLQLWKTRFLAFNSVSPHGFWIFFFAWKLKTQRFWIGMEEKFWANWSPVFLFPKKHFFCQKYWFWQNWLGIE